MNALVGLWEWQSLHLTVSPPPFVSIFAFEYEATTSRPFHNAPPLLTKIILAFYLVQKKLIPPSPSTVANILDPSKKLAEAAQNLAQGPPIEMVDVVFIGAGISGLTCADALLDKSPSLKVAIFDANDRVLHSKLVESYGAFEFDQGAFGLRDAFEPVE